MKNIKYFIANIILMLVSPYILAQGVPHPYSGGSHAGKNNDVMVLSVLFVMLVSIIAFTVYKHRQSE